MQQAHRSKKKSVTASYCTYQEFAERISCSKRYVAELAAQGVIPTVKLGRRCVRIPVEKALRVIEELEVGR